jgi:hypothetical protein
MFADENREFPITQRILEGLAGANMSVAERTNDEQQEEKCADAGIQRGSTALLRRRNRRGEDKATVRPGCLYGAYHRLHYHESALQVGPTVRVINGAASKAIQTSLRPALLRCLPPTSHSLERRAHRAGVDHQAAFTGDNRSVHHHGAHRGIPADGPDSNHRP